MSTQRRAIVLAAGLNALLLSGPHMLAGSSPLLIALSLAICSAWLVAEGLASNGRNSQSSGQPSSPPSSVLAQRLSLAGGLSLPLVYMIAAFDSVATVASAFAGAVFLILGVVIRVVAVKQLAASLVGASPAKDTLVSSGLYAVSRHPSELGLLFLLFGTAVFWLSAAAFLLAVAATVFSVARSNLEERELLAQFGDEYQQYRQRTWRYIGPLSSPVASS